jgi:hypothetical protein
MPFLARDFGRGLFFGESGAPNLAFRLSGLDCRQVP